jgi:signal transduction histidine kinase
MGQFIAGTLLVQALVFAAFLTFMVREQTVNRQQHEWQRLQNQTSIVANLVREPLSTGEEDLLQYVVRTLQITTSIRGARITDPAGQTLGFTAGRLPPSLDAHERAVLDKVNATGKYQLLAAEGDDEGVQPVMAGGHVVGIVWLTQNSSAVRRLPSLVLRSLLVYGLLALVGNLLLVWVLSDSMAQPLRQLRTATLRVQHDPDDLSAFPLPVLAHNEAGALTASVNAMVAEIALQRRGTQETLNLLDSMLKSVPTGFAFYNRDLRYVKLNERMASFHNIPVEEHFGKRFRDLAPPGAPTKLADEIESLLRKVFETGETIQDYEIEGNVLGTAGVRTFRVSYFPVYLGEGELRWVGLIATEITERKRVEETMRRSEKQAAAGRLAASIAHEINNPLESIINLLYLLRHDPAMSAQALEYTAMAQHESGRIAEIAQQTLRFYRQPVDASDVRLQDVVRAVLVLHHAQLQSPRVDVRLRIDDNARLFGYAGDVRHLVATLVGNAIEAMPRGGRLHVRVRESRRGGKRGLRVTVADTGSGMSPTVQRQIFEPFFTTKDGTGTGMGLWASKEGLARHRASITVRSRTSRFDGDRSGTVFVVFFPYDGVPRGPRIVHSAAEVLADHLV